MRTIRLPATTQHEVWTRICLINLWSGRACWTWVCGYEVSPPTSVCYPPRWACAGQRGQVSQAERSDAVAAWRPHSQNDRTKIREDRERSREIAGEGKGQRGGGSAVWWGFRGQEGRVTQHGDAETRGSVAACHLWASCVWWSWRSQILSPEGDKPHTGCHEIAYQAEFLACLINRNGSETKTINSGKTLLRPLLPQGGMRMNYRSPCLLTQKSHFLVVQYIVFASITGLWGEGKNTKAIWNSPDSDRSLTLAQIYHTANQHF